MEKPESIESLYRNIQNEVKKITGKLTSEEFQKIHKEYIRLSTLIEKADLYSENEEFKELSTSSIKYLLVNYEHAKFVDQNAISAQLGTQSVDSRKRNKLRLIILQIIEGMIWKFVSLVILDLKLFDYLKSIGQDNEVYKSFYNWIQLYGELRSIEISNNGGKGFVKFNVLESKNTMDGGAIAKRNYKIGKWKLEKELNEKISILEKNDRDNNGEEADGDADNFDDEIVSKIRVDQVLLAVVSSIGQLENYAMEREMLSNVVDNSTDLEFTIDGLKLTNDTNEDSDLRNKNNKVSKFDAGYTDKLESLDSTGKLISKEGKVLRPFTIVNSDQKRKDLHGKVFGTGQELPTMTVEEIVDLELANGGMVKPSEPEPEVDEDDYKWQDKETYRLREWDAFTDVNKKGSGNKMGNLG